MNLSNLKPAEGSVKAKKRIGRGQGSGTGGTSTRGHKGANSRSGNKKKHHFEGGQMPLQRRLPKRGFKNLGRVEYVAINLDKLQMLVEKTNLEKIDYDTLLENRVLKPNEKLKVLGRGEITSKIEIDAHAFSKSAKDAIEAKGGIANVLE